MKSLNAVFSPVALAAALGAMASLGACAHAQTDNLSENMAADPSADGSTPVAENGVILLESAYSVEETVTRLEAALAQRGVKVMAKVDHAANASGAGFDLPATTLVIFGNPAAGTQLMLAAPGAGLDLPMKALVREHNGAVTLSYNAIHYIASRHGVPGDMPVLSKIEGLLAAVAKEATGAN